ncbi:MAG: zf-HC2 domain-containing protein [Deltaproteobacteria bacterium]
MSTLHMQETLKEAIPLECRRVHTHLWDYLDGHLAPEETASLQAHIAECSECLDYGEFQQRFFQALGSLRVRGAVPWHVKARVIDLLASDGYSRG